jgi:hypothetical protein
MIFPEFANYIQMSPVSFCKIHTPFIPIILSIRCYWKISVHLFNGSIYWHLCVLLFHISVSWSSEMQFGVIHLKIRSVTQPYVASQHLNFVLVSLFLAAHTWQQILLHCISQCLLCLESSHLVGLGMKQSNAKWERVYIGVGWLCLL